MLILLKVTRSLQRNTTFPSSSCRIQNMQVLKAYDVWKPKTIFGKEFLGTQRDTFLIDPEGKIVAVWRKVSPKGHAEEVKAVLLEKKK